MHSMSYCDCGREIHWPKTVRYGDEWRCYNCGKIWELTPARRGVKPNYSVPSQQRRPSPKIVVVQVTAPQPQQRPGQWALPARVVHQLPAPSRGGLLAWLFGR